MTVEERIHAMNCKLNKDRIIQEEQALLEEREISEALKGVELLFDRVKDIVRLGEYCRENNISYPKGKYHKYESYYNDFESDGVRHIFGFIGEKGYCSHGGEIHVGWMNGGFCGDWDVHCDGNAFWLQHEKYVSHKRDVDSLSVIQRFISDFEVFEKNFYEWFDERCSQ